MSHILVVDDNPADVALFKEAFAEIGGGHIIQVAQNGQAALNMLLRDGQRHPDIIFLVLRMTLMSGHDVLALIETTPELKRVGYHLDQLCCTGPLQRLRWLGQRY